MRRGPGADEVGGYLGYGIEVATFEYLRSVAGIEGRWDGRAG